MFCMNEEIDETIPQSMCKRKVRKQFDCFGILDQISDISNIVVRDPIYVCLCFLFNVKKHGPKINEGKSNFIKAWRINVIFYPKMREKNRKRQKCELYAPIYSAEFFVQSRRRSVYDQLVRSINECFCFVSFFIFLYNS